MAYNVTVIQNNKTKKLTAENGELLSAVLLSGGFAVSHPCGGHGICKKCTVTVNGKPELSCTYSVNSDITVNLDNISRTVAVTVESDGGTTDANSFLALDIGSTTLALALVNSNGKVIATETENNPQTAFGADVISRIEYCTENGVDSLRTCLLNTLNKMISALCERNGAGQIYKMYVAGNTTMLHIFLGVNPSSMGVAPYMPTFLESRTVKGKTLGISNVENIITLPGISAFVGADISSGIYSLGKPAADKKTLLVDLGTNSEIALISENEIICTSAAAGPCFEGVNISCGMPACSGAVSNFDSRGIYSVIGNVEPEGLCATGLIDLIKYLIDVGRIDKTGYMDRDYNISEDVMLTQADVRQFQLAKSAVFSAIKILLNKTNTSFDEIDRFCVAGGFTAGLNINNAIAVGLFSYELQDKFIPVYNSSLSGVIKCGTEGTTDILPSDSSYIDMGSIPEFSEAFIKNMPFD